MLDSLIVALMLLGTGSTSGELPFWASSNRFGLMPQFNGTAAVLNARTEFDETETLQWRAGLSFAANLESAADNASPSGFSPRGAGMLDEFYGSCRWKAFTIDCGIMHRERDFTAPGDGFLGSLSSTSGNLAWSSNARSMPGYSITLAPVPVPFTGDRFCIYGRYGDYRTLDDRYVKDALMHNMQVGFLFHIGGRLDFRIALDHYALWGGVSPVYGAMPLTFDNYVRMATGSSASKSGNGSESDKINVIGDQRGAELFRFDWRGDGWVLTFQHDIPYDDGSGMGFQNFPDGVNTLHFGWNDRNRWISDILVEYATTMWQSGTYHDKMVDGRRVIFGGIDNYFTNEEYRSAWTAYGRTIGLPVFFPSGTRSGSWRQGALTYGVENNRTRYLHIGMAGKLFRVAPYRFVFTASHNYGTYTNPYKGESQIYREWGTVKETPLFQISAGFEGEIPSLFGIERLSLDYGVYSDRGEVLRNSFGALLGMRVKIY